MRIRLLALIIFAAGFTACSREEIAPVPVQNEGVTGKWQLTAILSGHSRTATGWVPVSDNYAEGLLLLPNGQYSKTVTNNNSTEVQTGQYTIAEGNMLILNAGNNQPAITFVIIEQTAGSLILEKPVKNGSVKMSFVRQGG